MVEKHSISTLYLNSPPTTPKKHFQCRRYWSILFWLHDIRARLAINSTGSKVCQQETKKKKGGGKKNISELF